jgi:digeranylgeranylglycerophospholipid reductase
MACSPPPQVDVLVVGAGPAGLTATNLLLRHGVSVALVDMRRRIGHPLRCAEVTNPRFFSRLGFEPRPAWVRWTLENGAVMLNRPRLEEEVAQILAGRGAAVCSATAVTAVSPYDGARRTATLTSDHERSQVSARLVLAADGVSSTIARMTGLAARLQAHELGACFAYRLKGITLADSRRLVMDFAQELKPYYFWIMPTGADEANVGVAVLADRGHAARQILERMMRGRRLEGGRVIERIVGFVPSALPLEVPLGDGVLVAGAAARLVDPVIGSGIELAAVSGALAAQTYLDARGVTTAADLGSYRQRLEPMYAVLRRSLLTRYVHVPTDPATSVTK